VTVIQLIKLVSNQPTR